MEPDLRLLTRIAHLHYIEGLKQADIADMIGLSRQSVGRFLKMAIENGIVEIKVHSPLQLVTELERQVESLFGLKEAIICRSASEADSAIKEAVGEAAASFLNSRVRDGDTIGVSWGSTMLQCVSAMPNVKTRSVAVVQLDGSTGQTPFPTRADYIVHQLSNALGAEPVLLPAPLLVDTQEIRDRLVSDTNIARALTAARKARIALVGVGAVSEASNLYRTGYMNDNLLRKLRRAKAIGDICGHYYDIRGDICLPELSERTIAIALSELREKEFSVALGGGSSKVDAILGALNGRLCNVLITDEMTATELVKRRERNG